jgi:lysophospholipase L1-like esterase
MKTAMKKRYILLFLAAGLFGLSGCQPEIEVPAPKKGSADFSKYLAVGNSLTAGYSDNGLYAESQASSYPALIAQQLQQISPQEFAQPAIPGNGSGYVYLKNLNLATFPPLIQFDVRPADPNWLNKVPGSFGNLGVPGLSVAQITINGLGASPTAGNPYFYRMLPEADAMKSYLNVVQESDHSFFTCWLGSNDVLGFATVGGVYGPGGAPGTGVGALTDPQVFQQNYQALVDALTDGGAKGLFLTIPDITLIPFFTVIPWNGLSLSAEQAAQANASYAAQIDPQVEAAVQAAVIQLVVTEEAVKANVIPPLATQAVFQQAYAQAIGAGLSPAEADAAATAYVQSAEGQAAIAGLIAALEADLRNHLTGAPISNPALEPLYDLIDQQLATNAALQAGIAAGIEQLTFAYENGLLDPATQALLDQTIAATAAQQIAALKAAGIYPTFNAGPNGFVIEVEQTATNPLGLRQMVAGEFVLLTALADGLITPQTAALPKPDQYILEADEIELVRQYTEEFNEIIIDIVRNDDSKANISYLESTPVLQKIIDGVFIDGVTVNGDFITGGLFSLDGVHMTPRGYALVANEVMAKINATFGSTIPPVNVNNYRAVVLP